LEGFVSHDRPPGLEGVYRQGTATDVAIGAAKFWFDKSQAWKRRALCSFVLVAATVGFELFERLSR